MTWNSLISLCSLDRASLQNSPIWKSVAGMELALSEFLADDKEIKENTGCKDTSDSATLMEELNNQFEHDSDFGSSPPACAAHDLTLPCMKDEFKTDFKVDACDFSPSPCATDRAIRKLDLSNCSDSERPVALSERSSSSKIRKMRVVDGRLQFVGFPPDLKQPEYKTSPRAFRRTGSAPPADNFWNLLELL
eukprot:CAMPEP_0172170636 /NCGR_PEP_ID=MMETSP1050-20130122/11386_1 /TAXON_ID=233186 /ORGANISM="Cryptomonas curvata, Strain CCAP979/52" /LENGTH=191 /DNA_ID=CAMNT_0012841857 /DNA_START=27 /DNA_END=602 /DNA_ORIENTATION=-